MGRLVGVREVGVVGVMGVRVLKECGGVVGVRLNCEEMACARRSHSALRLSCVGVREWKRETGFALGTVAGRMDSVREVGGGVCGSGRTAGACLVGVEGGDAVTGAIEESVRQPALLVSETRGVGSALEGDGGGE